ncbi:hypothetical protein B0H11DRAFT_1253116 [Mycena galericulata]|nr:hypothetical protein B0H11DRAFT_1253116 [Mycena galericulata]
MKSLLDSLTLPELPSLDTAFSSTSFRHTSFLSFLRRALNIQNLAARLTDREDDYFPLDDADVIFTPVLAAMSGLTTFILHADYADPVFGILETLETTRSFLPSIQTMAFSLHFAVEWSLEQTGVYAEILVGALASRSEPTSGVARLLNFDFTFHPPCKHFEIAGEAHADNTPLSRLRELKEKGMRPHWTARSFMGLGF